MAAVVTVKLRMWKEQRMLRKLRELKMWERRMFYLTKLKYTKKVDMSGKSKIMSLRETWLHF